MKDLYDVGEYYILYDLDTVNNDLTEFLCRYVGKDLDNGYYVFSILFNRRGEESAYSYEGIPENWFGSVDVADDNYVNMYIEKMNPWS